MQKIRFQSKQGFSIAMVLVSMSIMGVLGFTIFQYLQTTQLTYKASEVDQSVTLFTLDIQRALSNDDACLATFGGAFRMPTPWDATHPPKKDVPKIITLGGPANNEVLVPDLPPEIEIGTEGGAGVEGLTKLFKVGAIFVTNYEPQAPGCDLARPTDQCANKVELHIRYDKINKTHVTPQLWRFISLQVRTDANHKVTLCHAQITKDFIGTAEDQFVNIAGDVMTGPLHINLTAGPVERGLWVRGGYIQTDQFYIDSDRRLKSQVNDIQDPLAIVDQLKGREFNWKQSGERDFGFIAQEVEEIAPELVMTDRQTDLKSLKYASLIPLTSEAIKALHQENLAMKKELAELRQAVESCR
jgi:hypothetical protein